MNDPTLELAEHLICRPSVTPDDAGCQEVLIDRLEPLGFAIERMPCGEVQNLWARRGTEPPLFVFAGHTDVVPPGPLERWRSHPFLAETRDGALYGRGAADMKGSLAAIVTACERFVVEHPTHRGSIAVLVTSDEEGPARDGTARVVERLQARGEPIAWCLVGEPSSDRRLGDTAKNGRRGSLHGRLRLTGVQGHVAYPHLAQNPIHTVGLILAALADEVWDHGNTDFPATTLQITNLNSGTGATNVVPGELEMRFNFRFSTEVTEEQLQARVQEIVERELLNEEVKRQRVFGYGLEWQLSGRPFLTPRGELTEAVARAARAELGVTPRLSTAGGTSDGRFIAPTGAQVVELGPVNRSIHQVDEHVRIADLEALSRTYGRILAELLT